MVLKPRRTHGRNRNWIAVRATTGHGCLARDRRCHYRRDRDPRRNRLSLAGLAKMEPLVGRGLYGMGVWALGRPHHSFRKSRPSGPALFFAAALLGRAFR